MLKCMFSCLWFDRPIAAHFPRSILQVLGHGSCAFSFWIFCLISKENKYIFMLDLALGESSQQYKDQIFDAPCLPGTKWHQTRNILSGLRWIIYNLIRTKVSFYRDFYRGVGVEVGRSICDRCFSKTTLFMSSYVQKRAGPRVSQKAKDYRRIKRKA